MWLAATKTAGARHVLRHDRRLARQMPADMPADRAAPQIVTAARPEADDHLHGLAGEDFRLGRSRREIQHH